MEVLLCLADQPDQVISKQELLDSVWPEAYVEDGILAQSIHSVRKALGDNPRQPIYIETIPRRGYRLIAPVGAPEPTDQALDQSRDQSQAPTELAPTAKARSSSAIPTLTVITAIVAAIAGLIAILHSPSPTLLVLPFDRAAGLEDGPEAGFWSMLDQQLAGLTGLELSSRKSSEWASGQGINMDAIRRDLGASHLLEGTFWRSSSGNTWDLHLRLYRTKDGKNLWKEKLDFRFSNPEESIDIIVKAVSTRLELREVQARPQTFYSQVPEANEAYSRGLGLMAYEEEKAAQAVDQWKRAVELDPGFAAAQAMLSKASSFLYYNGQRGRGQTALQSLNRALDLAPDLKLSRLAAAYYHHWVEHDPRAAIQNFETADGGVPLTFEVHFGIGYARRNLGQVEEATGSLELAFELDPKSAGLAGEIAKTYSNLRRFDEAESWFELSLGLEANQAHLYADRAMNRFAKGCGEAKTCDFSGPRSLIEQAPAEAQAKLALYRLQFDLFELSELDDTERKRRLETIADRLEAIGGSRLDGDQSTAQAIFFRRAWILTELGRTAEVREMLEIFCQQAESSVLKAGDRPYPKDHSFLALAYALLGQRDQALLNGRKASDIALELSLYNGPRHEEYLAVVHTILGEHKEAIELLDRLLETPYQYAITKARLRFDPIWDPLRSEPAFQALLGS